MMVLGIDLGLKGAAALLDGHGRLAGVYAVPVVGPRSRPRGYDEAGIVALCGGILDRAHADDPDQALAVWCEAPTHVRIGGRLNVAATASLRESWARWDQVWAGLGIVVREVAPTTWHAAMLPRRRGRTRSSTKAVAVAAARVYWPAHPWSEERDGEADAALIAEYGRREEHLRRAAGGIE